MHPQVSNRFAQVITPFVPDKRVLLRTGCLTVLDSEDEDNGLDQETIQVRLHPLTSGALVRFQHSAYTALMCFLPFLSAHAADEGARVRRSCGGVGEGRRRRRAHIELDFDVPHRELRAEI